MAYTVKFNNTTQNLNAKFQNTQTINGLSAYELAVKNGFEGNEQEWLDSLKGEPGEPGAAGKDGYTPVKGKDYFDGQPGRDGIDGKDGYTPVKGKDYFDGADGSDGKDGQNGRDGQNGVSPNVTVQPITGGNRVTVTDANGTKTFDVMDGQKGEPGENAENDELFVVRMQSNKAVDKTYAEIKDAYNAGRVVLLIGTHGQVYTFTASLTDGLTFTSHSYRLYGSDSLYEDVVIISRDNTVTAQSALVRTPNYHSLKFTGAVNAEYDGYEAVTVNIPQGGGGGIDETQLNQAVQEALQEAKDSGVFDGAPGEKGDKGDKGDPGYTPVKGVDYFDGVDGQPGSPGSDGKDGVDGFSPTVSVSKFGKTTTISITDKNGTKTATINDGEDGKDAEGGEGGGAGGNTKQITGQINGSTVDFDMPVVDMIALGEGLKDYRIVMYSSETWEQNSYLVSSVNVVPSSSCTYVYLYATGADEYVVAQLSSRSGVASFSWYARPYYELPNPLGNANMYLGTDESGNYVLKDTLTSSTAMPVLQMLAADGVLTFMSMETGQPVTITLEMLLGEYGDGLANLKVLVVDNDVGIRIYSFGYVSNFDDTENPPYILFNNGDGKVIRMDVDGTLSYVPSYIEQTLLGGAW